MAAQPELPLTQAHVFPTWAPRGPALGSGFLPHPPTVQHFTSVCAGLCLVGFLPLNTLAVAARAAATKRHQRGLRRQFTGSALEAGSLSSRSWQGWLFLRAVRTSLLASGALLIMLGVAWLPLHLAFSLCVCVHISFFIKTLGVLG